MMERNILENADAFTHKMPEQAIREMRETWSLATPDHLVHSLPVRDFFRSCQECPKEGSAKCVFAVGVVPYQIALERGIESQIFDPFIEAVARNGSTLTFFVNQNARNMHWDEHQHYFELATRFPKFTFRKGVPFFKLPRTLSDFHYGAVYENVPASSQNPKHFEYNMPTKMFSYLEAGLPILTHDRATYVREFVETHSLGLVYDIDRIHEIPQMIARADHGELKSAVERYRDAHDMDSALNDLERAYPR
jgi:hypothetical protein